MTAGFKDVYASDGKHLGKVKETLPRRDPSTFDYPPHQLDGLDRMADLDRRH